MGVTSVSLQDSGAFWSEDFPSMSADSLLPLIQNDQMRAAFSRYGDQIDRTMTAICRT